MAAREIAKPNKMCRRVNFDVVTLHAVSQVNEIKNTNGILLRAYTEDLNLFQICERLVPDFSD